MKEIFEVVFLFALFAVLFLERYFHCRNHSGLGLSLSWWHLSGADSNFCHFEILYKSISGYLSHVNRCGYCLASSFQCYFFRISRGETSYYCQNIAHGGFVSNEDNVCVFSHIILLLVCSVTLPGMFAFFRDIALLV